MLSFGDKNRSDQKRSFYDNFTDLFLSVSKYRAKFPFREVVSQDEKQFWAKLSAVDDMQDEYSADLSFFKKRNNFLSRFLFLEPEYVADIDLEDFWEEYVTTKAPTAKLVLHLTNAVLVFSCIILGSDLVPSTDTDLFDFGRKFAISNNLVWLGLNIAIIGSLNRVHTIRQFTGKDMKSSWLFLGYFVIGIRIANIFLRLIWHASLIGEEHVKDSLHKLAYFSFVVLFIDILQISSFAMLPFPWPFALFFSVIEASGKAANLIILIRSVTNEQIRFILQYGALMIIVLLGYIISAAALHQLTVTNSYINSKLQIYVLRNKRNFISLLSAELRVPLQTISNISHYIVSSNMRSKNMVRLHNKILGCNKLINTLADNILLLTRFEERRMLSDGLGATSPVSVVKVVRDALSSPSLNMHFQFSSFVTIEIFPKDMLVVTNPELFQLAIQNLLLLFTSHFQQLVGRGALRLVSRHVRLMKLVVKALNSELHGSSICISLSIISPSQRMLTNMAALSETIYFLICRSICEHLQGRMKFENGSLEMELPLQTESNCPHESNEFVGSKKNTVNSHTSPSKGVPQVFHEVACVISRDHTLDQSVRELLIEIGWQSDKIETVSIAYHLRHQNPSMYQGYFIIFTDSYDICLSMREMGYANFIVHYSGAWMYLDEPTTKDYCNYKVSIPCFDRSREEFSNWISVIREQAMSPNCSMQGTNFTEPDRAVKISKETESSNWSKYTTIWTLAYNFLNNACFLFLYVVETKILWRNQSIFAKDLENIYQRFLIVLNFNKGYDPKAMFLDFQCYNIFVNIILQAFINQTNVMGSVLVSMPTLIFKYRKTIDHYILQRYQIDNSYFWRLFAVAFIVMIGCQTLAPFFDTSTMTTTKFQQMTPLEGLSHQFGSYKGYQIFQMLLTSVSIIASRVTYIPYPWNMLILVLLGARSCLLLIVIFGNFYPSGQISIFVLICIGLTATNMVDVYVFCIKNRMEFELLRRRLFGDIFLEKCLTIWQRECSEPIRLILDSKTELFEFLFDCDCSCNCECECDCDSKISPLYIQRYNSLTDGFQQLSHLFHMLEYKSLLMKKGLTIGESMPAQDVKQRGANDTTGSSSSGSAANSSGAGEALDGASNNEKNKAKSDKSDKSNKNDKNDKSDKSDMIFHAGALVLMRRELRVMCKSLCNTLDHNDMEVTLVLDIHPSLTMIRTDRTLLLSIISYALNRAVRYVQFINHSNPQVLARSHDVLVRVFPENETFGERVPRFTDPRLMRVEVVHTGFEISSEMQEEIMSTKCDLGIGHHIYQQVLLKYAQWHKYDTSRMADPFYRIHLSTSGARNHIVQTIQLVYFLYPTPYRFPQPADPQSRLICCHSINQRCAFTRYKRWKQLQSRRLDDRSIKENVSMSQPSQSSHNFSLLLVTTINRFRDAPDMASYVEETKHMTRILERHGWKVEKSDVAQLPNMWAFDNFDCILVDGLIDMKTVAADPGEINWTISKVIEYIKATGFCLSFGYFSRSNVSVKDPNINFTIRRPFLSAELDLITDLCCFADIFGHFGNSN